MKTMGNIGDESRPWYVKTNESVVTKVFGIKLIDRERFWKFEKLDKN